MFYFTFFLSKKNVWFHNQIVKGPGLEGHWRVCTYLSKDKKINSWVPVNIINNRPGPITTRVVVFNLDRTFEFWQFDYKVPSWDISVTRFPCVWFKLLPLSLTTAHPYIYMYIHTQIHTSTPFTSNDRSLPLSLLGFLVSICWDIYRYKYLYINLNTRECIGSWVDGEDDEESNWNEVETWQEDSREEPKNSHERSLLQACFPYSVPPLQGTYFQNIN